MTKPEYFPHPLAPKAEWMAYYGTLSTLELRRLVGRSMGLPTVGSRQDLLDRISAKYDEVGKQ